MELGKALTITYKMGSNLWDEYGHFCVSAKNPDEAVDALNTVHDFIVNHFNNDVPDRINDYVKLTTIKVNGEVHEVWEVFLSPEREGTIGFVFSIQDAKALLNASLGLKFTLDEEETEANNKQQEKEGEK